MKRVKTKKIWLLFALVGFLGGIKDLSDYWDRGYSINHKWNVKVEGTELLVQACVMIFTGLVALFFAFFSTKKATGKKDFSQQNVKPEGGPNSQ